MGVKVSTSMMCADFLRIGEVLKELAAAGADYIVPGSLMFKEDPREMRAWLATLGA